MSAAKTLHPKVAATGLAGAVTVIAAELGDLAGFHPKSPAFYTALGAIVATLAGFLKRST